MAGRIVVLISGTGSNMEALVGACRRGDVPGEVVAVVADRDCLGLDIASGLDIQTVKLEPKDFSSRDEWSAALTDKVVTFEPDLVVSAGFMRILSPSFVDAFKGRAINLHPSLLPAFSGAHAVRDALAAGAKETGTTVHFIDYDVDHGTIIAQERVEIAADDSVESLHERIKQREHDLLPRVCKDLLEGKVRLPSAPGPR
jgi:phosphoribosylglycinamide formyltransferase-1